MASKRLGALTRIRRGALGCGCGCGMKSGGALPLLRAAAMCTRLRLLCTHAPATFPTMASGSPVEAPPRRRRCFGLRLGLGLGGGLAFFTGVCGGAGGSVGSWGGAVRQGLGLGGRHLVWPSLLTQGLGNPSHNPNPNPSPNLVPNPPRYLQP